MVRSLEHTDCGSDDEADHAVTTKTGQSACALTFSTVLPAYHLPLGFFGMRAQDDGVGFAALGAFEHFAVRQGAAPEVIDGRHVSQIAATEDFQLGENPRPVSLVVLMGIFRVGGNGQHVE